MPETIREKYLIDKKAVLYKTTGCNSCQKTGYKGRTSLCEYLQISPSIKKLINSSSSESAIKKEARASGMRTLREDGIIKVEK